VIPEIQTGLYSAESRSPTTAALTPRKAPCAVPHRRRSSQNGSGPITSRKAGKKLRESDEIDEGLLVEPASADHKLIVKIAEVRDRAAEARHAEPRKYGQHFAGAAALCVRALRRNRVLIHRAIVDKFSHAGKILCAQ
jgi:hypothetical protein